MDRTILRRQTQLLRLMRETLGYTQQEWANELGLTYGETVGRWERGIRLIPLSRIAHIKLVLQKPRHLELLAANPAATAELQRGGFL